MGPEHHWGSREIPLAAGKDARARCASVASLAETQSEKLRPCQFLHARHVLQNSRPDLSEFALSRVGKNKVRLLGLEAHLSIRDRNHFVAVNHQNRPGRAPYRQVCVRNVNELSAEFFRGLPLAFDRLAAHEVNRNQINHPRLLELYRKRLKILPPTIEKSCRFAPTTDCLPPCPSLHTRHCSSSVQECQSGSPKCVWQNQRLHRSQYLVATIMHGSSQGETLWQNTPPGLLFSSPGISRALM